MYHYISYIYILLHLASKYQQYIYILYILMGKCLKNFSGLVEGTNKSHSCIFDMSHFACIYYTIISLLLISFFHESLV